MVVVVVCPGIVVVVVPGIVVVVACAHVESPDRSWAKFNDVSAHLFEIQTFAACTPAASALQIVIVPRLPEFTCPSGTMPITLPSTVTDVVDSLIENGPVPSLRTTITAVWPFAYASATEKWTWTFDLTAPERNVYAKLARAIVMTTNKIVPIAVETPFPGFLLRKERELINYI